jgi:hypothetical protein
VLAPDVTQPPCPLSVSPTGCAAGIICAYRYGLSRDALVKKFLFDRQRAARNSTARAQKSTSTGSGTPTLSVSTPILPGIAGQIAVTPVGAAGGNGATTELTPSQLVDQGLLVPQVCDTRARAHANAAPPGTHTPSLTLARGGTC